MLKARFGEDVVNRLGSNLEVKAGGAETQKKDNRGGKKKGG